MATFSHGLFGCYDNCGLCVVSWIAPCYTVGKTAEAVGEDCLLYGCGYMLVGCIAGGLIRGKVREQKGIEDEVWKDFLIHWCCPLCAIIQDNQEVLGSPFAGESMARV